MYATMAQTNLFSVFKKSEFKIVNQVFFRKLESSKKYLSSRVGQGEDHSLLIKDLDSLITEAVSYQISATIVGRQADLTAKVQLANQACDILNPGFQFKTMTFPCNLDRLLRNCDVVFLVIDSGQDIIPLEKRLVSKSQSTKIPLIVIDFNQYPNNIQSWLSHHNLSTHNYFNFTQKSSHNSQVSLISREQEYDDFIKPLRNQIILRIEAILEEKLLKIINKYFLQCKAQYWENIKHHKEAYLLGQNHPQLQEKVRQLPHKINKILQQNFKKVKQILSESKHELINPFASTSFIYDIQQIIRESTVIESREQETRYLNLVVIKDQHRQTIHSHILELYQQKIDLWIEQQWQFLEQELNLFSQLIEKSDRELQILDKLSSKDINLHLVPQPAFDVNKYICPTALSNINRTIFDYHYTQSSWFRLAIAIIVGSALFLLTDRLFGFIFLVVQIINLLTGQSTKSLKLKQQSKELKKSADNKYQNLVKFIADKLIQDINIFLDNEHHSYQEKVNSYIQESHSNLLKIKEKILFNQNKISQLNKDQENLLQIIRK